MLETSKHINEQSEISINQECDIDVDTANKAHVNSSTNGYRLDIGKWQPEHLPRNISQLITGTFSQVVITCPHRGQAEWGMFKLNGLERSYSGDWLTLANTALISSLSVSSFLRLLMIGVR